MNNVSVNVFPVLRVSLDPLVSLFFFPYPPAYCSVDRSEEHIMNGLGSPPKTTLRNWSARGMPSFKIIKMIACTN